MITDDVYQERTYTMPHITTTSLYIHIEVFLNLGLGQRVSGHMT